MTKLTSSPEAKPSKLSNLIPVFQYIWQGWKPYRFLGLLIALCISLDKLFWLYFSYELKDTIDHIGSAAMSRFLIILLFIFPIVTTASIFGDRLMAIVRIKMANDIRIGMFQHLQTLSTEFFKRSQAGDIVSRFTGDMFTIERVISDRALNASMSLLAALAYLAMMTYINWYLMVLSILILLLLLPLTRWVAPRLITAWYNVRQSEAQITNTIQENVRAQSVIKGFGLQDYMTETFKDRLNGFAKRYIEAFFLGAFTSKTVILIVMYVVFIIAYCGIVLTNLGLTSAGSVVAFLGLLIVFAKELVSLSNQMEYLFKMAGTLRRIEGLFEEKPKVDDAMTIGSLSDVQQSICFDQVSFNYTNHTKKELDGVNLTIPVGQYTIIVGPSGAGKSTLLNLLLRFYDVNQGQIKLDGQDIRKVSQQSLRSQMGVVFQDSFLFDTTVRENITLFDPAATQEQVEEAAKLAEIHDFIMMLPEGYDTQVGEAGGRLSGGQRQRIAIARALFRKPAILLLDEVTASLDTAAAASINATIKSLAKTVTIISVTHNLRHAAMADQIVVLDSGKLVECGQHHKLLKQKGIYFGLWVKQRVKDQKDLSAPQLLSAATV